MRLPPQDDYGSTLALPACLHGQPFLGPRVRRPQLRKCILANTSFCDCNVQSARCSLRCLFCSPQRHYSDVPRDHTPAMGIVLAVTAKKRSHSLRNSALHRMPPEILGIIFEHCLDEFSTSRTILPESPLLLGRVCSYWRSVTLRTPRLWTTLSFRFFETNVDRSHDSFKVASALETWLHRSHPFPLSIALTDNRIFQKDTEDVVIRLLSVLRMHASRWKAIHLKFSSDYFPQLSLLSSCAFTSLTSFSVQIDHMGWRRGLLSLSLDLSQANRLTSLAYTGPDHVIREEIFVDWACLTSIALSYDLHEAGGQSATFPRYFLMLAWCRNLTELSIGLSISLAQHLQFVQGDTVTPTPMIELPKLHTLRVRRLSRSAHACALIDVFVLPRLSTLHIDSAVLVGWDSLTPVSHPDLHPVQHPYTHAHTQPPLWHAHHFSSLLDRSACHLDALHIRDVDMSPAELTRLLTSPSTSSTLSTFTFEPYPRAYPMSEVLAHLISASIPEATLAPSPSLSPSSNPTSGSIPVTVVVAPRSLVLPSLTQLRLGCAHPSYLDPLADVIESRTSERAVQAGVRPLALFELVFYDFVHSHGQGEQPRRKACFDAFKERVLRCAREGGMDLEIRVERPYEPAYISVA